VAVVLEAAAWGKDAGPIVRKILDAWIATKGAAAPKDIPLPSAPATAAAPLAPVEDLPAQTSSSAEATP